MQGDDPPFLSVGTDVSAKYKGAFCEAKIKKVVRNIKCKVSLKAGGGSITVNDDVIKGTLRVGSTIEVKQDPKKEIMEAVITKIQDCSQYTVVFDDGDITTLRRSALCLKSGRHFNESETLDQLPLTHPEHFSTPVIAGRRGRRGRAQSEESSGSGGGRRAQRASEPHVGRVVLVEAGGGAERRRPHQPAFPALVVAPTAQIKVKEDYLVRSFKDGRYYTVPKKEAREFRKVSAPLEWAGVEAALQYLNQAVLPPHWDRDALFNEPRNTSDDSSDDEPREEKDHFVAQLYKFMDDRGTPLNRNPTIANKDIDLYRLFRVVQKLGGYNRVTNQNQWKTIADKMGFHPVTTSITNLCKQAYKKFLHSFEDFYRRLGVTLVAHPRGARTPPAGRSLIRDRDRLPPATPPAPGASEPPPTSPAPGPVASQRLKDSDKSETDKSEKSEKEDKPEKLEKKEKPHPSDEDDSADNQPLVNTTLPKIEKEKENDKEKSSTSTRTSEEKIVIKPRSQSKGRTLTPIKIESHDKRTPKRRPLSSKSESANAGSSRTSCRPHASTDSDSSGRASRCVITKKMQSRRSQSANSASSGNTIASNSSKRPRKRKIIEPTANEPTRMVSNVKAQVGDKLKVYYGPAQSESKVTYEAKVIEVSSEGMLRVHYTGWNTRYDEWIKPQRIALSVTQHEARNKKGTNSNRRVRAKRIEGSSARSDSDTDSDSDNDIKRPPKKLDEKSSVKTPLGSKDAKSSDSSSSSKPRKRPIRIASTPTTVSPSKKSRPNVAGHQGRDYDLNEIRSELKGLHTVKPEPEETPKQEPDKEGSPATIQPALTAETSQAEKQPEDVYEFKEPEPFELELHDEKKKRTHRIFDDISPSKYTSTLTKSLSEEISEDSLRPRPSSSKLSAFEDYIDIHNIERQSPEDNEYKDDLFSLDDDSFPGDGSSGPTFEGFTPAKNQETYSKKNKVSKLRELIDDSPDSPADDEQSSEDDEQEDISLKEENESNSTAPLAEESKVPAVNEENKDSKQDIIEEEKDESIKEATLEAKVIPQEVVAEQLKQIDLPKSTVVNPTTCIYEEPKEEPNKEESKENLNDPLTVMTNIEIIGSNLTVENDKNLDVKPMTSSTITIESITLSTITTEPTTSSTVTVEPSTSSTITIEPTTSSTISIDPPSSPLIDTEEDKSEPDSPARIDIIPEPPPAFLLQSEGPKIAEKLLKAINSAKRLSMSPPPAIDRPISPKTDSLILTRPEIKLCPKSPELNAPSIIVEPTNIKPVTRVDPLKKTTETSDSIFGESSNLTDVKRNSIEIKVVKPEDPSPPRLHSPLSILERRKSVADLPLSVPGKNNKVLSDTIQKLSSQIYQTAAAAALPPPTFPAKQEKSESSDSDDSNRRLVIDKAAVESWSGAEAGRRALHAGKSPGEWSAGESLLMLEDACKNERKHSASVVVAGSGRAPAVVVPVTGPAPAEDDSNISLLLCEETIPGSPAPDSEPAPARQRLHMPFASASQHHSKAEEPAGAGGAAGAAWGRRAAGSTSPDTSPDRSPRLKRSISERDSPISRKEDERRHSVHDSDKPQGRSRKASESSAGAAGGAGRGRRRARRDTDEPSHHPTGKTYNFQVELDPAWDCQTRIDVLTANLNELRKTYHDLRGELAAIDRRRKKLRRKEREAVKAAKAACS